MKAAQDRRVQLNDTELSKLRKSVEAAPPANQTMTLDLEHQRWPAREKSYFG